MLHFETRHRCVIQLVASSDLQGWPKSEDDFCPFLTYFNFPEHQEAVNYGKNLVRGGLAVDFSVVSDSERHFPDGIEIEVRGLSEKVLDQLIYEFECQDWFNATFFDGPLLEQIYQLECDRQDLTDDYFDSAWF